MLGPGLITGVSDDDPSSIGAYIQVGTGFGYTLLWPLFFVWPLFAGIQHICALIGGVTGKGIAAGLRDYFPRSILVLSVLLLLAANLVTLAADLGAMGDCFATVCGGRTLFYVVGTGLLSALLELFVPYRGYVKYLKWMCLSILAYIVAAFVAHPAWRAVFHGTLVPHWAWNRHFAIGFMGVVGATFDPYPLFWQASEETEEQRTHYGRKPLKQAPDQAPSQLPRIAMDTWSGIPLSALVGWFIMVTCAATLGAHGLTQVDTASQAASALKPVAGRFAALLFSLGIIGTGLLSIPILAGSAAYAAGEALGWRVSLEDKPRHAKGFYSIIIVSIAVGVAANIAGFNPMKALYWASVLNGIVSAPLMVFVMALTHRSDIMGPIPIPRFLKVLGWGATVVVVCSAVMSVVALLGPLRG